MTRTGRAIRVIRVLVASPSDVQAEREACESVVDELNLIVPRAQSMQFELVRWETHANPGLGDDAQAVINQQVVDDYDIFVGIMWSRFGSPTGRADSGTEEEFNRAYARWRVDPASVSVMLYFKDAPVPFEAINPEQIARLLAFRERVGKLGLYKTFATTDEFAALLRVHLARTFQEPRASLIRASSEAPPIDDDDEGYIDLAETANDALRRSAESAQRMNEAMVDVSERITTRAAEIGGLMAEPDETRLAEVKRWVKRVATDMNAYADRVDAELPTFEKELKDGVTAFGKAFAIEAALGHFDTLKAQSIGEVLDSAVASLRNARGSILAMRQSVVDVPKIATGINRARRRMLNTIDALVAKWDSAEALISELRQSIRVEQETQ